jgi:hypothetical protein
MSMPTTGFLLLALCSSIAASGLYEDPELGIEFMTVGEINNTPYESAFGGDINGRGSVSYSYRIARTELTCGQYLEFFNRFYIQFEPFFTLLPRGESSFYWVGPGVPLRYANGFNDPASVSVQLSWRQAAMFCNWMHNGQRDDWASVLDGAYDVSTFTREPDFGDFHDQTTRHPDARYWIPSLDEYLKAGHYDPDKNGNGPGWWEYAHSSDAEIIPGLPGIGESGRDIPESVIRDMYGPATRTDTIPLGLYPDIQSPWGLIDLHGGNEEWLEDWEPGSRRARRVKESSNSSHITWGTTSDRAWFYWSSAPTSIRCGVRIASSVHDLADLNQDWQINFYDVSEFINRYAQGDLTIDFNNNGVLDEGDVWAFLEAIQPDIP